MAKDTEKKRKTMLKEKILVTGGLGYIGSHTSVELLDAGYDIVIADNLSNSKEEVAARIKELAGKDFDFHKLDVSDEKAMRGLFERYKFAAVIHFAGYKAVGESVEKPLEYYQNNIGSTLTLAKLMLEFKVKSMIFSSSATVYGDPASVPITEDFPLSATNPYGRSKLMIEEMLRDLAVAAEDFSMVLLRYFNPAGSHKSGRIGEDPSGIPNNLFPVVSQVAIGRLKEVKIYGSDYPTADGTGVRDYIHVVDLAQGHVKALEYSLVNTGAIAVNLGTGTGYSVLEIIHAFEKASGVTIPYVFAKRRAGDIATCYANPQRAGELFLWSAKLGLDEMCEDAWRWQKNNPKGYE